MLLKVLLFTPNLMTSLGLYTEALGLKCVHLSDTFAELQDQRGTSIILSKSQSLVYTYSGFTPLLMFQCENYEEIREKVVKYGCLSENDLVRNNSDFRNNSEGNEDQLEKITYFKSPEGLSFALMQLKEDTVIKDEVAEEHPAAEEIKKFIRKLKL